MLIQGIVRGKQIELDREIGLPFGSVVMVDIQTKPLTLDEKRNLVDALCGAWASDASTLSIFVEIERQRAITPPREVNFDAPS
ncbi:MAG: hypothetical protein HZC40_23655 [Chloroflexi bacterium]|nr:hypothetical protein [Chloroflexota bacterium]